MLLSSQEVRLFCNQRVQENIIISEQEQHFTKLINNLDNIDKSLSRSHDLINLQNKLIYLIIFCYVFVAYIFTFRI